MLKKVMERGSLLCLDKMRRLVLLFIFTLMIGAGYAAEDWGDINNGSDLNVSIPDDDLLIEDESTIFVDEVDVASSGDSSDTMYNRDFYIAVGLGILGILLIGLFIYFFLRGPKNKWKDN